MNLKIRVAVICHENYIYQWQKSVILALTQSPRFQIGKIFLYGQGHGQCQKKEKVPSPFWKAYHRLFMGTSKSFQKVTLKPLLENIPREALDREETLLKSPDGPWDLLLNLTQKPLGVSKRDFPKGIWEFSAPDLGDDRHPPQDFEEFLEGRPYTLNLFARFSDAPPEIIFQGHSKNIRSSYVKTLDLALSLCHDWIPRAAQSPNPDLGTFLPLPRKENFISFPSLFQILFQQIVLYLKDFLESEFCQEHWNVGVIPQPISHFIKNPLPEGIVWPPDKNMDHFVADPFAVFRDGKLIILVEGFFKNLPSSKGYLAWLTYDGKTFSGVSAFRKESFHLSYPYLITHEGSIFCIPESGENGRVDLYKARDFPRQWTKVATLLENTAAIDASLVFYQGFWYLFGTLAGNGPLEKLHIWFSREMTGPFHPHPLNPVKCDVTSARSAGNLFFHEGKLYRPSQDCSRTYGGAIWLNEVVELTPTSFQERKIQHLTLSKSGPYPHGCHTISAAGPYTVIDGKVFHWSFQKTMDWFRRKFFS